MKKRSTFPSTRFILNFPLAVLMLCFWGLNHQAFTQNQTSPLELDPQGIQAQPTAIPAFIGYTQKALLKNQSLSNIPTPIHSLQEYQQIFGGAPSLQFKLTESGVTIPNRYYLFESVKLFYENGGNTCYIISVGNYDDPIKLDDLTKPLENGGTLSKEEAPTMVIIPDGVSLQNDEYYLLYSYILSHCAQMKNRIGLLDIPGGFNAETQEQDIATFRQYMSSMLEFSRYGVAYYPWVVTNIVEDAELSFNNFENGLSDLKQLASTFEDTEGKQVNQLINRYFPSNARGRTSKETELKNISELHQRLSEISPAYQQVIKEMTLRANLSPVSGIMAGIFTKVDQEFGVWHAPFNWPLKGVVGPSVPISSELQKRLRIDPETGLSINPIIKDATKSALIMGRRTLAGNLNEWRYVSVIRTGMMIEQSLQKEVTHFMEHLNSKNPMHRRQLKARMIQFLTALWEQGGLDGASMEDAFSVNDGLDTPEGQYDIMEGRINLKVKYFVSRPIESVRLEFENAW